MLKYRCLVLDHDDTVVQTERAIGYPYFREYLQKIRPGTDISLEEYIHVFHNAIFPDVCRARWNFNEGELAEEYTNWQIYRRTTVAPLCPGIDSVIRRQKAEGGLVCVVSLSDKEDVLHDYRHHFGFEPDAVYGKELLRDLRKPNPWPVLDILERFSLKPEQMLMVDDMRLGWDMATKAGIDTAFAGWSRRDFPELMTEMEEICKFSFDSAEKLEEFLF